MLTIRQEPFGTTRSGAQVIRTVIANNQGMELALINYGAIIQSLRLPDRNGTPANIVLGCDNIADYEYNDAYLGAVAGRFANRINKGQFQLNGQLYQLDCNNGPNHLHGGPDGFSRVLWQQDIKENADAVSVTMTYTSADNEEGYPGTVHASVTYTLDENNQLDIAYSATTDKTTIINLTQHSYFNLAGHGDCLDHHLRLNADHYLPIDDTAIPLGHPEPVAGTPFDFRTLKTIGKDIHTEHTQISRGRGFDHNMCLNDPDTYREIAEVFEPVSGRHMRVMSDQPGVQFYTGNYLDGIPAPDGKTWSNQQGFCLETQTWPDAPNQPAFPTATLEPGQVYQHRTTLIFKISD